jgi:hypothetical protein
VDITVNAGGQSYEQVDHFTYLGTRLSEGGGLSREIEQRKGKAWGKWMARKKSLYKNKGISPRVKLKMLKTEVVETLMYGCAAWTTSTANIEALNSIHYKLLLQTLGLWKKKKETDRPRSYHSILKEYGCVSMEVTLKWRRLKWAGEVMRMKDNRLPKIMMFGELEGGTRSQGGQINQWSTEVFEDMVDFGWIKKKWEGVSATDWSKYKEKVWKEEISVMAMKPVAVWTAALIKGETKFMREWHAKEEAESQKRKRFRKIAFIRLRKNVVWKGWVPTAAPAGWEDFEMKWRDVLLCKDTREHFAMKQKEQDIEEGEPLLQQIEEEYLLRLEKEEDEEEAWLYWLELIEEDKLLRRKKKQEEEEKQGMLVLLEIDRIYLLRKKQEEEDERGRLLLLELDEQCMLEERDFAMG